MKPQAIEVTVGERAITPPVRAVQSDSGRELHCVLADFEIPSGTTARFFARKPSGAQIYNNCAVSGNEVVVKLTTQTLAEVGVVPCQVELRKGGERLTSFKFAIEVQETLATDAALESFDETDVLQGLIDEMQRLIDEMNGKVPDLTVNRVLVSDTDGRMSASTISTTELEKLDGARSNIQEQIDALTTVDNGIKRQITELQGAMNTDDIQAQIDALQRVDEEINAQITTLEEADTTMQSQINDLKKQIDGGLYASKEIYGDTAISLGRKGDAGTNSIAYGNAPTATAQYSQAFGQGKATAQYAHAEGAGTASGGYSHAEGVSSATGSYSHAEGERNIASGRSAHAEGGHGTAAQPNTASGDASHAEGERTTASGNASHAEGIGTTASGDASHAEGETTIASGNYSHAEGSNTKAMGDCSFACGRYNVGTSTSNLVEVGCGGPKINQNAMSIQNTGDMNVKGTVTGSTTADYAEFFEWADGNPDGEDRVGLFVTLEGERIRVAEPSDSYILGIVSGAPFVVGNGDCDVWNGMLLRDEFGRIIREEQEVPVMETDPETGEERQAIGEDGEPLTEMEMQEVINPDYDHNQPYVSRFDRKEWSPVGMLGVLRVRQDGTCMADGYCKCGDGGIATACAEGDKGAYRVIAIVSEKVAKAIIR